MPDIEQQEPPVSIEHNLRELVRRRWRWMARSLGWTVVVPLLRIRADRRLDVLRPFGVTVLTVNWNSWDHLAVLIDVVRRRSPSDTEILVVDNGSLRHPGKPVAVVPGISMVHLPANVGHDLALDIGMLLSETEYTVVLDVDAFPLNNRWLEALIAPLSAGTQISGARLNREYVHPCCLAMRTSRFVQRGHSFRSHYRPRRSGEDASGDVGEEMSAREAPALHFFDVTSQRGPGDVGTIFGDLVYHNFYATRFSATADKTLDRFVQLKDAEQAWREALRLYLP